MKSRPLAVLFLVLGLFSNNEHAEGIVVDHLAANQFDQIPPSVLDDIRAEYNTGWPPKILLGTRSHGTQLDIGLGILESYDFPLYERIPIQKVTGLAGQSYDGVFWTDATRIYLEDRPETKVVLWAFCRLITGVLTEQEIDEYLTDMSELETDFPAVRFVYMTDVINEDGESSEVEQRNDQIREYCLANDKILYDFAAITARDPNGVYHAGTSEGGSTWCADWCGEVGDPLCAECSETTCPHSHCFDCVRKGRALWWMLAKLQGWEPTPVSVPAGTEAALVLHPSWPNPFNPSVKISFSLGTRQYVKLSVFDARGRAVCQLFEGEIDAGEHSVVWQGRDAHGVSLPSGPYLIRLGSATHSASDKIYLVK